MCFYDVIVMSWHVHAKELKSNHVNILEKCKYLHIAVHCQISDIINRFVLKSFTSPHEKFFQKTKLGEISQFGLVDPPRPHPKVEWIQETRGDYEMCDTLNVID